VRSAITDSELLDCYNLPAKALVPLQAVLPQAPRDPMLNQRLASLYARAERFRDAADCCETLQDVYWKAGHAEQAVRYADMAAKYRERAGAEAEPASQAAEPVAEQSAPPAVSEPLAVAEPPASAEPPTAAEPPAEPVAVHPEQAAAEGSATFISGEEALAGHLSVLGDLVEEVRFYLSQFMFDEAQGAIEKCAALAPDFTSLPELRQELAAARAKHFEMPEVEVEIEQPEAELPVSATDIEPPGWVAPATITPPPVSIPAPVVHAATPAAHTPEEPIPVVAKPGVLNDMVLELEQALHLDGAAPVVVSSDAQAAAAARAPVPQPTLSAAPVVPARVPDAVPVQPDSTLSDLFEEFKGEVEHETAAETDDPETHYNLGVAFREMGLLDEAIGELQKVCHAIDQGQPFPRTMETYTWLAQCLLDKGAPQAAIKWYERALRIPHLEQDARTAVYYELAAAQEASGNSRAALDNYMEVFATNIDYRDVAERIKSLQPVVKS
jgi:tetratricopeptide (TPR) repeat protein